MPELTVKNCEPLGSSVGERMQNERWGTIQSRGSNWEATRRGSIYALLVC